MNGVAAKENEKGRRNDDNSKEDRLGVLSCGVVPEHGFRGYVERDGGARVCADADGDAHGQRTCQHGG